MHHQSILPQYKKNSEISVKPNSHSFSKLLTIGLNKYLTNVKRSVISMIKVSASNIRLSLKGMVLGHFLSYYKTCLDFVHTYVHVRVEPC